VVNPKIRSISDTHNLGISLIYLAMYKLSCFGIHHSYLVSSRFSFRVTDKKFILR
jgi:hypothetical protein